MKDNLDKILYQTFQKEILPAASLNQRVLEIAKEQEINMKKNEHSNKISKFVRTKSLARIAVFAVAILLTTGGTVYAAVNIIYNNVLAIDDKNISQDVESVTVKKLDADELNAKYSTITEVEDILGIKLLKSDKAYKSPIAKIDISEFQDESSTSYTISDINYFANDMDMDLNQDKEGTVWKNTGDRPYLISYNARLYTTSEQGDGFVDQYDNSSWVEKYEATNGLEANIFKFEGEYNALVIKDNIVYTFTVSSSFSEKACLQEMESFIDSLY